LRVSM